MSEEQTKGEEQVEIPWLSEPLPLAEAVEAVARVIDEDVNQGTDLGEDVADLDGRAEDLDRRVGRLERHVEALEDGSTVACPSCGRTDDVLKAGVAAARFVEEGALSAANVRALNEESHVCLECQEAFTPDAEG